jgi:methylated-DNA-[protein]-cysteine S-methyltransferase
MQGLLSSVEWSENHLARCQKHSMPGSISELIDRIQNYFFKGAPLGEAPWHLLNQEEWTPFQKDVYLAISKIPHGETRTYGWVASRIGKVSASRAVGQALRKNPFPILIPCHRVLGTKSFGGFMGISDPSQPELQLKLRLMKLEEEYINPSFSFLSKSSDWSGFKQLGI